MMGKRPHLAWVTNLDAPYRRSVWSALAGEWDLSVWLLDGGSTKGLPANRRADWIRSQPDFDAYSVRSLKTLRVQRGEERYYIARQIARVLSAAEVIILGGWESPAYWQLALGARRRGIKTIGFYESHRASSSSSAGPIASVRRAWFRRLDAVVVVGAASEEAVREFSVPAGQIFRGFNSVDVAQIHALATLLRRESARGHRYIFVGQLISRKNVSLLLAAFADIRRNGDSLHIVGTGRLRDQLEQEVSSFNLTQVVRFTDGDANSDLPEMLASSDTLVLPSTVEVWGLVVNEALAAGLHVVVSNRAGVAFDVEGMQGVYVCAPERVALRKAMAQSRAEFRGPVREPGILDYGPERFAKVVSDAGIFALGR